MITVLRELLRLWGIHNNIQTTCTFSDHAKNTCKVSQTDPHKTIGGVTHTSYPIIIHFDIIQD